eukprot:3026698-Prymnesium_polylepis.1
MSPAPGGWPPPRCPPRTSARRRSPPQASPPPARRRAPPPPPPLPPPQSARRAAVRGSAPSGVPSTRPAAAASGGRRWRRPRRLASCGRVPRTAAGRGSHPPAIHAPHTPHDRCATRERARHAQAWARGGRRWESCATHTHTRGGVARVPWSGRACAAGGAVARGAALWRRPVAPPCALSRAVCPLSPSLALSASRPPLPSLALSASRPPSPSLPPPLPLFPRAPW